MDHLAGLYTVIRLKANWPFRAKAVEPAIPEPRNIVEALAVQRYRKRVPWIQAMQQLFNHYQQTGDDFQALKVALIVANALPYLEHPQRIAAQLLMRAGRDIEARRYLKRAAELTATAGETR